MARILLIEDDADAALAFRSMLELDGHTVHWAPSGKAAGTALREKAPFDLVLTDILMPDMDGLECIQLIKREHPQMPIIAMTGKRDSPYLRTAAHFGARLTLAKPFGLPELREAVTQSLAG